MWSTRRLRSFARKIMTICYRTDARLSYLWRERILTTLKLQRDETNTTHLVTVNVNDLTIVRPIASVIQKRAIIAE